MTTAEKIKKLLEVTGWTQELLAGKLHCSFNSVNRWMAGTREPLALYKRALEKYFNRYLPVEGDRHE